MVTTMDVASMKTVTAHLPVSPFDPNHDAVLGKIDELARCF